MSLYRPAPVEDISYCGCVLPAGVYGAHGWHWHRADQAHLYDLAKRRFAEARTGYSAAMLRKEWEQWLEAEAVQGKFDRNAGMHLEWKHYLGLPFAVERCPAYMAVWIESQRAEKRRKAATGKGKSRLGEDD